MWASLPQITVSIQVINQIAVTALLDKSGIGVYTPN
jgi:hypothetical protein